MMDATIDMSEVVAHALKTKAEAEKLQLKDLDKFFVKVRPGPEGHHIYPF